MHCSASTYKYSINYWRVERHYSGFDLSSQNFPANKAGELFKPSGEAASLLGLI